MAVPGIEDIGGFVANLAGQEKWFLALTDPDGSQHEVEVGDVMRADGFLPVILKAAETVWQDLTGHGFGLVLVEESTALLGYAIERIADVPFTILTHTILHTLELVRTGDKVSLNALVTVSKILQARSLAR